MADSRIDDLRRRLERDPGSRLFAQLAEELRKAGELEEAIGVARSGLAHHPAYPSARLTLGRALLDSGDPRAARVELETAVKGAPDNILANRLLGEALESLGDLGGALTQYRATLAVAPGDRNVEGRIEEIARRLKGGEVGGGPGGTTAPIAAAASAPPEVPSARPLSAPEPEPEDEAIAPTIRIRAPGEPPLPPRRPAAPPPIAPAAPPAIPPAPPIQPTPPPTGQARGPAEEPAVEPAPEPALEPALERVAAVDAEAPDVAPTLPPSHVASFEPEEELPPTLPPSTGGVPGPTDEESSAGGGEPPAFVAPEEPTVEPLPPAAEAPPAAPPPPREPTPMAPAPRVDLPASAPEPAVAPPAAALERPGPLPEPVGAREGEAGPFEPSPPLETPPPEEPERSGGSEAGGPTGTPLSSVTLAELYFQQGLLERAVEVYRQVLDEEPGNARARLRLDEVEALVTAAAADLPVPPSVGPAHDREVRRQALVRTIELLEGLLAVVRRR